ncbi:DsbA family protein [Streptantibioticus ferralitis]|uniref:Thioredoxin domain-containing protein n=1 Tax=Streptantibioticus ferralitis TaxID=236510 RepID=A0ABT5ZB28_9ACTN|nr:thioredoxin domain-containing protein [Streptantibioticus ferralitis]MDF2261050.1 thioredoxin domain-containing protein [Streptantibioticus ferralitis]
MHPQATTPRPARVPHGANEEGDGIVIGDGPVSLDAYIDFQCPYCRQFTGTSGPLLDGLLADGRITAIYHPMSFLDAMSTNHYSARASAASGCAADSGSFVEYAYALFANQPPEGGPGLTDEELVVLGATAGLTGAFADCVRLGAHRDWPPYVTSRAYQRGVRGTPTVLVEGAPVPPHPSLIRSAVARVLPHMV